jgi:hypothetical protein
MSFATLLDDGTYKVEIITDRTSYEFIGKPIAAQDVTEEMDLFFLDDGSGTILHVQK